MLSLISMADTPAPTVVSPVRARSRKGTLVVAFARPRARTAAELFGNGAQVAGLANFAGQQPISKVNYSHTTRIAAMKGSGAPGSHPARDPV